MPFDRPTLTALIDRGESDLESRLPGAEARARWSNLSVLARVQAGTVHGLYGYLDWLAEQLMIDTAEAEHLERWAAIWGVARKPAAFTAGNLDFTGADTTVIPTSTRLQRGDGVTYDTTADATIVAGAATAPVTAVDAAGAGDAAAGEALTLVSPIAGIDSAATVAAGGLTGGADEEDDDSLRARLLDRIRRPPAGGAAFDYEKWALEVAEVTRVWVAPLEQGLGTVVVRFAVDDDLAGPIPSAPQIQAVQDFIDALRPVTADVTILAPIAVALDLTIQLTPNTATVQAAVAAELADLLLREAAPGATILISHIREAISIAASETDHVVTVPAADVSHAAGEIAVLGIITWV